MQEEIVEHDLAAGAVRDRLVMANQRPFKCPGELEQVLGEIPYGFPTHPSSLLYLVCLCRQLGSHRNTLAGIDSQFPIGKLADLQPVQRLRRRAADNIALLIKFRSVTGTSETFLRFVNNTSH